MIASAHLIAAILAHIKTRVRLKQAFGVLKQRFRCLLIPLRTGFLLLRCHQSHAGRYASRFARLNDICLLFRARYA